MKSNSQVAIGILDQIEAYMSTPGTITKGRELANKWSLNVIKVWYDNDIKNLLTNYPKSPLWKLKFFRRSFYKRFALCYLHLGPLGNIRRHLKYIGIKLGDAFCEGNDSKLKNFVLSNTKQTQTNTRAL